MCLFLCFLGAILSKNIVKSWGVEKNKSEGVSIEGGFTPSTQFALQIQHSNDSNVDQKPFSFYKVLLLFFKWFIGNLVAFFFKNVILLWIDFKNSTKLLTKI